MMAVTASIRGMMSAIVKTTNDGMGEYQKKLKFILRILVPLKINVDDVTIWTLTMRKK